MSRRTTKQRRAARRRRAWSQLRWYPMPVHPSLIAELRAVCVEIIAGKFLPPRTAP